MCEADNHWVGHIGGKSVQQSGWGQAVTDFEAVVDDFNVRGRRDEIPHPGWCTKFRFCPDCGISLASLDLRDPNWKS